MLPNRCWLHQPPFLKNMCLIKMGKAVLNHRFLVEYYCFSAVGVVVIWSSFGILVGTLKQRVQGFATFGKRV